MGSTPVCQVTTAGCIRPTFADCLSYFQAAYRAIYGADVYLGADSQDGQFIALLANALHDANGETLAAYNSFSPTTAQGVPLDRIVKINGIRRKRATYSTAPLRVVGQVGTQILNGIVQDTAGYRWALPATATIPDLGEIVVNITCQTIGEIELPLGGIDTDAGNGSIVNVTRGWQSCNTIAAASPGLPIESDSALRQRQAASTALPSLSVTDGLYGALAAISGVNRLKIYENDTEATDINGLPGNAISVVLDGGDPQIIANVMYLKKSPTVSTFGNTFQYITTSSGITKPVRFFYLAHVPIGLAITVQRLTGYTLAVENALRAAVAAFINGLDIDEDVELDQVFVAAKLYDAVGSKTFKLVSLTLGRLTNPYTNTDVPIAFNEAATCDASNVVMTVLSST